MENLPSTDNLMKKTYNAPTIHAITVMALRPLTASDSGVNSDGSKVTLQGVQHSNAANAASRASDDWDWDD